MKQFYIIPFILLTIPISCSKKDCPPPQSQLYYPSEELNSLFHDVQMSGIFEDSKTFVDYIPKCEPAWIASKYEEQKVDESFNLETFVDTHFLPFPLGDSMVIDHSQLTMEEYLHEQWNNLIRINDSSVYLGSLLPLPKPYVVPGGRFREIYYWDSYFTMLGLEESGKIDLIKDMVDNFSYLIDTYGHIPNGNRTYYLSRSQPPYYALMITLLKEHIEENEIVQYLPYLEKEYAFWMEGAEDLTEENPRNKRVVRIGSVVLNRYWDDLPEPRPESYREDYLLAQIVPVEKREDFYRHLKAGAESGWDYSSRWFKDGKSLQTIQTTEIVPIDLNCLLYHLEKTIADLYEIKGDMQLFSHFTALADIRKQTINSLFWNKEQGYFADFDLSKDSVSHQLTAATTSPLFFNIADEDKAIIATQNIKDQLLLDGGIVTSLQNTGQQWDYPNGWAPLQWLAIKGALNYEQNDLALDIAERWIGLNEKVFKDTGKMMEKYNVEDTTLIGGGGEYPLQDGFGWTNGVALKIINELKVEQDKNTLEYPLEQ